MIRRLLMVVLTLLGTTMLQAAPVLHFNDEPEHPHYGSIEIRELDDLTVKFLKGQPQTLSQWQQILSVRVKNSDSGDETDLPAVTGDYEITERGVVRFSPRFPLTSGPVYRAIFNPNVAVRQTSQQINHKTDFEPLVLEFDIPPVTAERATIVTGVFPSGDVLPENLLRFYIYFSSPMQSGWSHDSIYLLDAQGQPLESAFLDLRTELWNPAMTRLTVLLDPGRIKQGVGPNLAGGAPLREGNTYTLVIDNSMKNANGAAVQQKFTKTFQVEKAWRKPLLPEEWTIKVPEAATRQPLEVCFTRALDHAMLRRVIHIADRNNRIIGGQIVISDKEKRWVFKPQEPWKAGSYRIQIAPELEDVSGNNLKAAFDVAISNEVITTENTLHEISFDVTDNPGTRTAL
jgi:hypothetical protein